MSSTAPDDHTLVTAAQAGDRSSMDQLLRRHYDRIYGVCRRITGQDADAADAAQDAMIAIVRGLAAFDGRSTVATWVYRIATNASLDELRRQRRRPVLPLTGHDREGAAPIEHADPHTMSRFDVVADRMLLDRALSELAEDFRLPVVLRDIGDLEYAEIAAVLDIPVGTVKSRIARGRATLAETLRRLGEPQHPRPTSNQDQPIQNQPGSRPDMTPDPT